MGQNYGQQSYQQNNQQGYQQNNGQQNFGQSMNAAWVCPMCGSANTSKFCNNCGAQRPV